jgi:hypothetical protein
MINFIKTNRLCLLIVLPFIFTGCCDDKGKEITSFTAEIEYMTEEGQGWPAEAPDCCYTWDVEEVPDDEEISQVKVEYIEIDFETGSMVFPNKINLKAPGGREEEFSANEGDWMPTEPFVLDISAGDESIFLDDGEPGEFPDGLWELTILEINNESVTDCSDVKVTLLIKGEYQTWDSGGYLMLFHR